MKNEYEKQYKEALEDAKETILENWKDDMVDKMLEERREWIWKEMEATEFKQIPPKAKYFD